MLRLFVVLAAIAVALPAVGQETPQTIRIQTFNIWYGGEQVSLGAVADAIRASKADIVGVQETDGSLAKLAAMTGLTHYDIRRNILSRYPIFDPAVGERMAPGSGPYSMPPLDEDAVHAFIMIAPGKVIAVANTHLTSDPYGPDAVRDGQSADEVIRIEQDTRVPEATLLADGLKPVIDKGIPTFLTGDFNTPSHLDWSAAMVPVRAQVKYSLDWPVSRLLANAGFADSYRTVHPDPATAPGLTWTAGYPSPHLKPSETFDRIDWVLYAHATPIASAVVGEAGGPDVEIGVVPWPSDHRSVVTTFEVVPADAPAMIAVEPSRVEQHQDFLIRAFEPGFGNWTGVVVPRGGDPKIEGLTGIADVSLTDRPSIKLNALTLAPGAYDAVMLGSDGAELARTHFNVVADNARPSIALDKTDYAVGDSIAVGWTAALGERFEWLGVYAKGDPSVYNYHGYVYAGGHVDGSAIIDSAVFGGPLPPGDYEVRLMRDDHYSVEAVAAFTVK
ncbi:MAG: endonuclease/exonuclease/phosphatase family protein [Devosia sp.]